MMTKFKVGDKVRAIDASHGWGSVSEGDIGVVASVSSYGDRIYVDFPTFKHWTATPKVLELVEKVTKKQRIETLEQSVEKQAEQIAKLQSTIAKLREALS